MATADFPQHFEMQNRNQPNTPKERHRRVKKGLTDEEIRKKELKVVNVIVDYPGSILGGCFTLCIITAIISFGVVGFSISDSRLEDRDDHRTEKYDAVFQVQDLIDDQPTGRDVQEGAPKHLLRSATLTGWGIIYEAGGDDVFTTENIRFMRETEQKIEMHPEFKYHCRLRWIPKGSDCPGVDCPWYIPQWDFGTMQDGSRLVCAANLQSLSWIMYNMRLAFVSNTTITACDLNTEFERCVAEAFPVYLTLLDGKSRDEWQAIMADGGLEPTEREVMAFLRASARLMTTEKEYSWLTPFFGKGWNNPALPVSDSARWKSKVTRASILFGGPREKVNPATIKVPCQSITGESTCAATKGCVYTNFGGMWKNRTECSYDQYMEVSDVADSSTNKDQQDDFADWGEQFIDYFNDREGPSDVLWISSSLLFEFFLQIIIRDSLLGIGSFIFVYLYLQIHTGSFFLATLGMIQVIMPFPMAYFVYRVIFQVGAFYGLSALTLYIVLAIGADDIFVFMDNWVQADVSPRPDNAMYMKGRMAIAWKTAGIAMGITSLTTMVAFIATMTSPLLEIGLFGLIAALLVGFDYILVMTFFAAAVVVYHRKFEHTIGCCCCGQQMFGKWCSCCTCYTEEVDATFLKDPLDCMQTSRTAHCTCETIEEARAQYGAELDHSPKAAQQRQVTPTAAAQVTEDYKTDPDYKRSRLAGIVLMVLAALVYTVSYIMLVSDRSSSNRYLSLVGMLCVGLFIFCGAMNAFTAAKNRRQQLGHAEGMSFMETTLAPFLAGTGGSIPVRMARFVPAVVLVIFWAIMLTYAVELGPTTKSTQWLPDWHPLQRYFNAFSNDFPTNDQDFVQAVTVSFGLDPANPIDRSGTDKYDMDDRGKPVYTNVDLSSMESQRFLKEFCARTLEESRKGRKLQRTLMDDRDQNCIMTGFEKYLSTKGRSFPVPPSDFVSEMWGFYLEEQFQIHENNTFPRPYESYVGKVLFDFGTGKKNPPTGVKVMMLEFNTTLKQHGNTHAGIEEWYNEWDSWVGSVGSGEPQWVKDIYGSKPFSLKGKIMHSSDVWVWMQTQWLLVQGAINGAVLSLALATAIIFLATLNILVAILVLIELIGVVGCVLGLTAALGWELGMIESVCITVLVGLSVDYVVHLAVHYNHVKVKRTKDDEHPCFPALVYLSDTPKLREYILEATERQRRVHETVCHMGGTVLGGAATSLGAAIILFTTWVQFYFKFGAFFFMTILFSYLWSMFFFLPLMSLVGPEKEFLSIRPLLAKCFPRFFRKHEEEPSDSSGNTTPTTAQAPQAPQVTAKALPTATYGGQPSFSHPPTYYQPQPLQPQPLAPGNMAVNYSGAGQSSHPVGPHTANGYLARPATTGTAYNSGALPSNYYGNGGNVYHGYDSSPSSNPPYHRYM